MATLEAAHAVRMASVLSRLPCRGLRPQPGWATMGPPSGAVGWLLTLRRPRRAGPHGLTWRSRTWT